MTDQEKCLVREINAIQNQVICGDFYQELPKIRTKTVDMILTDLPYNMTSCKWDEKIDLRQMFGYFKHVIKDGGATVLTSSQPFTSMLVMSNYEMFNHEWIWQKTRLTNFLSLHTQPAKIHESVLVFGKNIKYNPIKWRVTEDKIDKRKTINDPITNKDGYVGIIKRVRKKDDGSRFPLSIINIPNKNHKSLHPTQKPVELFEYLIKTYTNEGDLVLDCCAGSGTTAIACLNTNRKYICIEKDEDYFKIMQDRIAKHIESSRDVKWLS